jgi:hypothetical protein
MDQAASDTTDRSGPIFLIDELISRPGEGEALLEVYRRLIVVPAEQRGMCLSRTLVEPCVWGKTSPNRLIFMWSLPNAMAAWRQKSTNRNDPAIAGAWREIDGMVSERKRAFVCDAEIIGELAARSEIDQYEAPADA